MRSLRAPATRRRPLAEGRFELAHHRQLLLAEPGRDAELENDMLVAALAALKRRELLAAQHRGIAMLGAGGDLDRLASLQGWDAHLSAEDRPRHRQLDARDQLGALAGEALVGPDPHLDVEVALAAAHLARVSGPGDPDPLPVLDPGRHVDLPGAALRGPPGPLAALAGLLGDLAVAAAAIAGGGAHDLAEDAAGDLS